VGHDGVQAREQTLYGFLGMKMTQNAAVPTSDIDRCGATIVEHPEMKRIHRLRTAIVLAPQASRSSHGIAKQGNDGGSRS
jgi:hypothetical protein